jgi:hypothetical protein
MKRRNALLYTEQELEVMQGEANAKALSQLVEQQIKLNDGRRKLEANLFSQLFKRADYHAGDVVFISQELYPAINFNSDQIKYSAHIKRNEYLVSAKAFTPAEIGK